MADKLKNYINKSMCRKCGGNCCKEMPGIIFPEDLKIISKETIIYLLNSGNYSIDCWEGEIENPYYLRPATKEGKGKLLDKSWGGECVFWSPKGCHLDIKSRPFGCRSLEPRDFGANCFIHDGDKLSAAKAWEPYGHLFKEILKDS